jgi:hypothetical protein
MELTILILLAVSFIIVISIDTRQKVLFQDDRVFLLLSRASLGNVARFFTEGGQLFCQYSKALTRC